MVRGVTSNSAARLRQQQDVGVVVVRFADQRGQRLGLRLPPTRLLARGLRLDALPEGGLLDDKPT
jgi:hypothetical protein